MGGGLFRWIIATARCFVFSRVERCCSCAWAIIQYIVVSIDGLSL